MICSLSKKSGRDSIILKNSSHFSLGSNIPGSSINPGRKLGPKLGRYWLESEGPFYGACQQSASQGTHRYPETTSSRQVLATPAERKRSPISISYGGSEDACRSADRVDRSRSSAHSYVSSEGEAGFYG